MPGQSGNFTDFNFNLPPVISGDLVAFEADGPSGVTGVYVDNLDTHTLTKVLATGDILDGNTVNVVNVGPNGLDGNQLALDVGFSGGSGAIYVANLGTAAVPEPSSLALLASGLACALVLRAKQIRKTADPAA